MLRTQDKFRSRLPIGIVLISLIVHALIAAAAVKSGLWHGNGQDFFVMYTGTRHALQGENPYGRTYIEKALRDYRGMAGEAPGVEAGFFYPPQALLLFRPFVLLPFRESVSAWWLLNTLLVVACGLLLKIEAERDGNQWKLAAALTIAITLLNPLSQREFSLGQTSFIVPGMFALGYWLTVRGRTWLGPALFSFTAVKPHLALPLLMLIPLFFGWGVAIRCAVLVVLFTFSGCLVTTGTLKTLQDFVHFSQTGPESIGFNQVQYNQIISWNHLLYELTGIAINLSIPQILAGYALLAAMLWTRVAWIQKRRLSRPLLVAMAGMASLFCSQPKGYDFVMSVLIAPYVFRLLRAGDRRTPILLGALFTLAAVPLGVFAAIAHHAHLGQRPTEMLLSYRAFVVAGMTLTILLRGEPASNLFEDASARAPDSGVAMTV